MLDERAGKMEKSGLETGGVVIPGGISSSSSGISSSSNSSSSGASPTYQQWGESNCFGGCSTPPGPASDYSFAETESSEDDDFVAGLAEQMAHSMLDDSDETSEVVVVDRFGLWGESSWKNPVPHQQHQQQHQQQQQQHRSMESPRKSSWSAGCWSSSGYSNNNNSSSSSKVSSQVSSPPSTPGAAATDDGWDLAIGAEMSSRFQQQSDEQQQQQGGYVSPRGAATVAAAAAANHLPEVQWRHGSTGLDSSLCVLAKPYAAAVQKGWTQKEDDLAPLPQCRGAKQAVAATGVWNRHIRPQQQAPPPPPPPAARSTYRCGVSPRPIGHWPTLPPPANGSVMRAVFLGGAAEKSTGTGVFLPRSTNDYSKRKSSCSSVLLPSRIVQVLNLNIDDMRCYPTVHHPGAAPGAAPIPAGGGIDAAANLTYPADEDWPSSQWKTYSTCSHVHQASESTLPTEWSY